MSTADIETPVEKQDNKDENSAPATLPVIGIIYPPPEVRSILSFTLGYFIFNFIRFLMCIYLNKI